MCGRAAQTQHAVGFAARSLGASPARKTRGDGSASTASKSNMKGGQKSSLGNVINNNSHINSSSSNNNNDPAVDYTSSNATSAPHAHEWRDNYNMCPGMDAMVIFKDGEDRDCGAIRMDRKHWGLIVKPGTERTPLPPPGRERMALHFSNLMYNARSDTLYSKPTFSRLAGQGRSCVVALDGYFEWKSSPLAGGKGKKQPYYVYRKKNAKEEETMHQQEQQPNLLLAGLWTRVKTGIPEEPFLDTFTILTTEACSSIQWLHHRMPVCIWDLDLARQWLEQPSEALHQTLDQAARKKIDGFDWHMVTTEMSSVKFRDKSAIKAIPKPQSVLSCFSARAAETIKNDPIRRSLCDHDKTVANSPPPFGKSPLRAIEERDDQERNEKGKKKRSATTPLKQTAATRQKLSPVKKGTITSFFSPKKSPK